MVITFLRVKHRNVISLSFLYSYLALQLYHLVRIHTVRRWCQAAAPPPECLLLRPALPPCLPTHLLLMQIEVPNIFLAKSD